MLPIAIATIVFHACVSCPLAEIKGASADCEVQPKSTQKFSLSIYIYTKKENGDQMEKVGQASACWREKILDKRFSTRGLTGGIGNDIGNMVLSAWIVTCCRGQARQNEPISCSDSPCGIEAKEQLPPTSEVGDLSVKIALSTVSITSRRHKRSPYVIYYNIRG